MISGLSNQLTTAVIDRLYQEWNRVKISLVTDLASQALGETVTLEKAKQDVVDLEEKHSQMSDIFQQVIAHHDELSELAEKTCLCSQRSIFGFSLADSAAWVGAIGLGAYSFFSNPSEESSSQNTSYKIGSLILFVISQLSSKASQYSSSEKTKRLKSIQRAMTRSFEVIKQKEIIDATAEMTTKSRQLLFSRDFDTDPEAIVAQWVTFRDSFKEKIEGNREPINGSHVNLYVVSEV